MIVESLGNLLDVSSRWTPIIPAGRLATYGNHFYAYEAIYRMQPNVRTCVDFLARNVAQLGLHWFQRTGETDRRRLRTHPAADLLGRPNPWTTPYRLIESLMGDLGIYFNAYWLKVFDSEKPSLLRIPPHLVVVEGGLAPARYRIDFGGEQRIYGPESIVHFRGYNPASAAQGLSPLETLRRVLAEEQSMGQYRESFWTNAARMSGIIERPKDAPEWSPTARDRFKAEFEALYAGEDNSGRTAVLEEGMSWKQVSFSAQESEYLAGRKLTREECARAYHIPLPMVGILDHATFSNIKEQHRNLYQDCLGPWLRMIEEDIELQLLPDLEDSSDVYCEFNIAEKLSGSFEDQTSALQSAIGRPWMTANEGRARMNLPSLDGDADELVTPLNVLTGGQASPRDAASDSQPVATQSHGFAQTKAKAGTIDPSQPKLQERHIEKWEQVIRATFRRQREAVLSGVPKKALVESDVNALWDADRWNRELMIDYYRMNRATALVWARHMADILNYELDEERMEEWLATRARIAAEEINAHTRDEIATALTEDVPRDSLEHMFDIAVTSRAAQIAHTGVTMAVAFGSQEGARQGGLRTKTWNVNSANPRPEHAAMNGQTVAIDQVFSNGMRWPHDPNGGPDNNAGCLCTVSFGR